MPPRIASVTGNWTTAGTWKAGFANGQVFTGVGTTTLGAAYATPATVAGLTGNTVDGVVLQINAATGSPNGTMDVQLYNISSSTGLQTTSVDCDELPVNGGWILVPWTAQALTTGTNYGLRLRLTGNTQGSVSVRVVSSGGTNFNKCFRITTTGAPAASAEKIFVCGSFSASPTTVTAITVTMNLNSVTNDFGVIDVGKSGTLAWATATATSIKASGAHNIWDGGTVTMGTSGTPISSGVTAAWYLDCATSDGESGIVIQNGGTFRAWGHQRWSSALVKTKLTAAAAIGATTLNIADNTGWLSGDVVAIAQTNRSATVATSEAVAMTANAGATTLTVGATVNYHAGVAPIQAEVINLTRNCVLRPTTLGAPTANPPGVAARNCYLNAKATSTVDMGYVELTDFGYFIIGKRGVEIETTTGSFRMERCSFNGTADYGITTTGSALDNVTITECVGFNLAVNNSPFLNDSGTHSGSALSYTNNTFFSRKTTAASNNAVVYLSDIDVTFTGNTLVGAYIGLALRHVTDSPGTFTNNTIHNAFNTGIHVGRGHSNLIMTGTKVYRCGDATAGYGIQYGPSVDTTLPGAGFSNHRWDSPEVFGNKWNFYCGPGYAVAGLIINNGVFNGSGQQDANDAAAPSDDGIFFSGYSRTGVELNDCQFGVTAANKDAHTGGDIEFSSTHVQAVCRGTIFASTVDLKNPTELKKGSYFRIQREDNTIKVHRALFWNGESKYDTAIYHPPGLPPSERLTPNLNATTGERLESGRRRIAVLSGQTLSPRVWVVMGTGYTLANNPRLLLKANKTAGIASDTVLDTVAGATALGEWEQLGGVATPVVTDDAVLEFVVDCYGSSGFINVDDWTPG